MNVWIHYFLTSATITIIQLSSVFLPTCCGQQSMANYRVCMNTGNSRMAARDETRQDKKEIIRTKTFRLLTLKLELKKNIYIYIYLYKTNKLHGLSPRENYTYRATAACRRSDCQLLRIKGAMWSA
jgi:hypothetical protein